MVVSTFYVISIPVLLSAMTGYDGSTISYVNIDNGDRIIPASSVEFGDMVHSAGNLTFTPPTCSDEVSVLEYDWQRRSFGLCKISWYSLARLVR
jgi:hypothetical protein